VENNKPSSKKKQTLQEIEDNGSKTGAGLETVIFGSDDKG
jgi:hypothetical protein